MMRRGTAANEELINRANYLLDGAAMTDVQLQAYRTFHLIIQSGLIVAGTVLVVAVFGLNEVFKSGLAAGGLWYTAWISRQVMTRLRIVIATSTDDVNYWHRKLICLENELPETQRYFTEFKIEQKLKKSDPNYIETLRNVFMQQRQIEESDANRLIERGSGHLRYMLEEEMLRLISFLWNFFIVISVIDMAYLIANRVF
ncbi:MAG: hypothetical protein H7Y09_00715 [Chitinophagaceae bacterium]|nr:hypothetical protein [Anaerolineae bacterium]